jgi:hypothetical protein
MPVRQGMGWNILTKTRGVCIIVSLSPIIEDIEGHMCIPEINPSFLEG